jgi:hypothetical protein
VPKFSAGLADKDRRRYIKANNPLLYQNIPIKLSFEQDRPVIKLKQKIMIKGKIHRKYEKAKTPYHRLMKSKEVLDKTKKQLKQIYDSANPAELKREIDKMTWQLYKIHQDKQNKQNRIKNLQRSNQKA